MTYPQPFFHPRGCDPWACDAWTSVSGGGSHAASRSQAHRDDVAPPPRLDWSRVLRWRTSDGSEVSR